MDTGSLVHDSEVNVLARRPAASAEKGGLLELHPSTRHADCQANLTNHTQEIPTTKAPQLGGLLSFPKCFRSEFKESSEI